MISISSTNLKKMLGQPLNINDNWITFIQYHNQKHIFMLYFYLSLMQSMFQRNYQHRVLQMTMSQIYGSSFILIPLDRKKKEIHEMKWFGLIKFIIIFSFICIYCIESKLRLILTPLFVFTRLYMDFYSLI